MPYFDYDYCAASLNQILDDLEVYIFFDELCSRIAKCIK